MTWRVAVDLEMSGIGPMVFDFDDQLDAQQAFQEIAQVKGTGLPATYKCKAGKAWDQTAEEKVDVISVPNVAGVSGPIQV